jgi:biopolymer transport protein TolR
MDLDYKSSAGSISEMNLTPLVDVMMVLMIIFMVTSSQDPSGIDLDLPEADAPEIKKIEDKLTIYMELNETITISKGESKIIKTDILNVRKALEANFPNNKEADIKGDKNLKYQKIISLLMETQKAGITRLGLLINKVDKKESR